MAVTFKLGNTTNFFDLTDSADFHLARGYVPTVAQITGDGSIPPYVTEVIPVIIQCTTDDNFAGTLQWFALFQRQAAEYWADPTAITPIWLTCKLADETTARRALVKSMHLELNNTMGGLYDAGPVLEDGRAATIIIERHPYWERDSGQTMPQEALVTGLVQSYDYTDAGAAVAAHDIVGDVGARIEKLFFGPNSADSIARLWAGIRSASKHGTLANFITTWECEDGANNGNESGIADTVDATASDGNMVRITETDLDWDQSTNGNVFYEVLEIELKDVSANESDNYGTFLWLLRAKVSAGEWRVYARYGFSGMPDDDRIYGQVISITSTSWNIYETDIQNVPIRNLQAATPAQAADTYDQYFAIQIWAQRVSGAGTLDLDCLHPIPVDEGYGVFKGLPPNTAVFLAFQSPKDEGWSATVTAGGWSTPGLMSMSNFTLPPGDGRMIIAWARESSSDITDQLQMATGDTGTYYERWLSLRGAE